MNGYDVEFRSRSFVKDVEEAHRQRKLVAEARRYQERTKGAHTPKVQGRLTAFIYSLRLRLDRLTTPAEEPLIS